MMIKKILTLFTLFMPYAAYGDTSLYDLSTSVRALGMGGAYTAVVDDSFSMFYNPAGLAKNTGVYWHVADIKAGATNSSAISGVADLVSGGGGGGIGTILEPFMGEPLSIGAGASTALILPYFGFMYYADINYDINLSNPAFADFEITTITDTGMAMGFGLPLIPGTLSAGLVTKRIARTGGTAIVSGEVLGDPNASYTDDLGYEGVAYSLDAGFNLTVPMPVFTPTFSLVWKNVGYTTYNNINLATEPENVILGAAFEVDMPLFSILPSIEFRHLTNTDMQFANKIFLGIEFGMPMLDIRAGFHQGYYTLGLGLGLGPMDLDFATYGVELGEYPGQQEDRRYVLSLSFDVGIGGVSNLFDSSSERAGAEGSVGAARRRRLKQRR